MDYGYRKSINLRNAMFSSENLYNLFKPLNNENLITEYEVIIGGTLLTANLDKGALIVNLINSQNITSQFKDFKNLIVEDDKGYIKEYSYLQNTYQVDLYKVNSLEVSYIEVEREAIKIREWLKSFETIEYLQGLESGILPCYSQIGYSAELINKKFVNRAFFDFQIITRTEIKEAVGLVERAFIENTLILGG